MRVLFWSESFWPSIGGSETFAAVLIEGLRTRGHDFEVVTRQNAEDEPLTDRWQGIPVHRIPVDERAATECDLGVILPARHRIAKLKQRFQPDLVHISLPGPSLVVHRFTASSAWPCPTLVSLHVPLEPTLVVHKRPAYLTTRDADWVTACSRALLDHGRWMVPEIRGRSSVVYNGLSACEIPIPAARRPGPFKLLCAGRLVEQKGFATAIDAMHRVHQRGHDVELTILGDGPMRAEWTALAQRLGVSSRVVFAGWAEQSEVLAKMAQADAIVVPSEWEPFGLVAVQAAQCSKPVIAARVDGLPEVVLDGVTGLLAAPGDAAAFADCIEHLLLDPSLAQTLGAAGRQRAAECFDSARMVDSVRGTVRANRASLLHRQQTEALECPTSTSA